MRMVQYMEKYGTIYEIYSTDEEYYKYLAFEGQVVGNGESTKPHGIGKYFNHRNEVLYEGNWFNGNPHGSGKVYYNYSVYEVEVFDGEIKSGKQYFCNELIYFGELSGDIHKVVRNGRGRYYHDGQLIYDGTWQYDEKHGTGKQYENNTLVYQGGFKAGCKSGKGCSYYVSSGNLKYDGFWANDKPDGLGKLLDENGYIISEGRWWNGNFIEGDGSDEQGNNEVMVSSGSPKLFTQGSGFNKGKYLLSSILPTSSNWSFQSVYKGPAQLMDIYFNSTINSATWKEPEMAISERGEIFTVSDKYLQSTMIYEGHLWDFIYTAFSSPVILNDNNICLIGNSENYNSELYLINYEGIVQWKSCIGNGAINKAPAIGSTGNFYLIQRIEKKLHSYSAAGDLLWKSIIPEAKTDDGDRAVIIDKNEIIYAALDNTISAFDRTGKLVWSIRLDASSMSCLNYKTVDCNLVISENGTLFTTNDAGTILYGLSDSGEVKVKVDISNHCGVNGDGIVTIATLADGTIRMAIPLNNKLISFNQDGSINWVYTSDDNPSWSFKARPVVDSSGTTYFPTSKTLLVIDSAGNMVTSVPTSRLTNPYKIEAFETVALAILPNRKLAYIGDGKLYILK